MANRRYKALENEGNMDEQGDDLFPEGSEEVAPEGEVKDMPQEPYGSSVLRRLHKDGSLLMKDYDEMHGMLEDFHPVKGFLQSHLGALEKHLTGIEKLHSKHYKDLPPLEDAMEQEGEEKDLDEGEGLEDGPEGEEAFEEKDLDPTIPDDSEAPEEVPAEEAVEGMLEDESPEEGQKSLRRYRRKGACPKCGKENCDGCKRLGRKSTEGYENPLSNSDVPPAEFEPGAGAKALEPHEHAHVSEAAGFLKEKSEPHSPFEDEDRMKSYHYHKSLKAIGDVMGSDSLGGDVETIPGEEKDVYPPGHKDFDEETEGKSEIGSPEWEAEEQQEPEHMKHYKARKHCKDASDFFKDLSQVQQFNDDYRAKAAHHHKALEGISQTGELDEIPKDLSDGLEDGPPGEEEAFEPGEMGEKGGLQDAVKVVIQTKQAERPGMSGIYYVYAADSSGNPIGKKYTYGSSSEARRNAKSSWLNPKGVPVEEKSLKKSQDKEEDKDELKRLKSLAIRQNRQMQANMKKLRALTNGATKH